MNPKGWGFLISTELPVYHMPTNCDKIWNLCDHNIFIDFCILDKT